MMGRTCSIHGRCHKCVQFFFANPKRGAFRRLGREWQDNIKLDVSSSGFRYTILTFSCQRKELSAYIKGGTFVEQLSYCLASLASGVCYWVRTSAPCAVCSLDCRPTLFRHLQRMSVCWRAVRLVTCIAHRLLIVGLMYSSVWCWIGKRRSWLIRDTITAFAWKDRRWSGSELSTPRMQT